ncbi:RNA polymerase beta'' subunit family protein [[Mycoplasma] collis]|uniref:hypothetical protein n=1 Tax=[Mycoplasma] collis TaxID=2127 RepID=UPI00051C3E25|nr:hypothetical protein [[Mycoplasma] collis]
MKKILYSLLIVNLPIVSLVVSCNKTTNEIKTINLNKSQLNSIKKTENKFLFNFKNNLINDKNFIQGTISYKNSANSLNNQVIKINFINNELLFELNFNEIKENSTFYLDKFISRDKNIILKFDNIEFILNKDDSKKNVIKVPKKTKEKEEIDNKKEDDKNKNKKDEKVSSKPDFSNKENEEENKENNSRENSVDSSTKIDEQKNSEQLKENKNNINEDNAKNENKISNLENNKINENSIPSENNDENNVEIKNKNDDLNIDLNKQKEDLSIENENVNKKSDSDLNNPKIDEDNNENNDNLELFVNKITNINNKLNEKILVFEIKNKKLKNIENELSFQINNNKYNKKFYLWENQIFIKINDLVTDLNQISNLILNNVEINLEKTKLNIENIINDSEISNFNLLNNEFSFSQNENDLVININENIKNFKDNQTLILEFKPLQNNKNFIAKYLAIFRNNQIIVKNIEWINNFYNEYFLTSISTSDNLNKYIIPEFLSFKLKNNESLEIKKINLKEKRINEYELTFNLLNLKDEIFYQNKRFILTFNESKSLNEKNNFSLNKELKKVYSFNEIKNGILINNLPEGFKWKLTKITLVYKEDLSLINELNNAANVSSPFNTPSYKELNFKIIKDENSEVSFTNNQIVIDDLSEKDTLILSNNNLKKLNHYYLVKSQLNLDLQNESDKNFLLNKQEIKIKKDDQNIINHDWKILQENFNEKTLIQNSNNYYEIKKSLSLFDNSSYKNTFINFNFFGTYDYANLHKWQYFNDSYAVSFLLDDLKANKKLENLYIHLIADWKEIYKNRGNNIAIHFKDFNAGNEHIWKRSKEDIENIINQRLKLDVLIENEEIVFRISPKKGIINTKMHIHNFSKDISTFIEKNNNFISYMYLTEQNINPDTDALVSKSNNWEYKTIIENVVSDKEKLKTFKKRYKFDEINLKFDKSNEDDVIKKIKARAFANRDGSLWMIAKVNDNPDDHRYYVGTNRHVPILTNTTLAIPKTHENIRDREAIFNKNKQWNLKSKVFWLAKDNKIIDGSDKYESSKNGADLQVGIIDITELVEYYILNKDKVDKENDDNFLIAKHFYNWKNLDSIKISQKLKNLKINHIFDSYISAFPNDLDAELGKLTEDSRFFERKNIQLKMKFGNLLTIASNEGYENPEISDNIGMHNFKDALNNTEGEIWDKINVLWAGSSGSAIYDDEGNLYGVHMGMYSSLWQTALISNPRLDLFGHYNEFNNKSFASKIQLANRLYPEKYKLISSFGEFENPIK